MALQGPLGDRDFRVGGSALRQQGHHGSERHDFSHVSCRDQGSGTGPMTSVMAL